MATGATPSGGTALSQLPAPQQRTAVTVGGVSAPIVFEGIPPGLVGVVQINFQVPQSVAAGVQPVVVAVGGVFRAEPRSCSCGKAGEAASLRRGSEPSRPRRQAVFAGTESRGHCTWCYDREIHFSFIFSSAPLTVAALIRAASVSERLLLSVRSVGQEPGGPFLEVP